MNRRGRGNRGSAYDQNAQRLRDKLRENRQGQDEEEGEGSESNNRSHPPSHLRGPDIGFWYAHRLNERSKKEAEMEVLTPRSNVTLPSDTIKSLKVSIDNFNRNRALKLQSVRDVQSDNNMTLFDHIIQYVRMFLLACLLSLVAFMENFFDIEIRRKPNASKINKEFIDSFKSETTTNYGEQHEPTEEDEQLCEEFMQKSFLNENYVEILEKRQQLPAFDKRLEIIETVKCNQVTLIEGNTGCGKTTQVAQFLLDDALMNCRATKTRILCTQPRRIAATSIAKRVAYERCEELGESVGYQIRLEKIMPRISGSILFCTTGVVLRLLEIYPTLHEYSHLIIDEIHERTFQTDLCLAILKELIKHRKDLKVILMSATLNAKSFSEYFSNCPIIHIEGMTFPVQDIYLEEIIENTGYDKFDTGMKRRFNDSEFDLAVRSKIHKLGPEFSNKTKAILSTPESEQAKEHFIEFMIQYIATNKPPGAILVILSGYMMISKVHSILISSPFFNSSMFEIHAVHSRLTGNDQLKIFDRPPEGVRKIIISTPLCETSITIDDVVYVINAGKMKRPSFDFVKNAKVLEDEWITKANETQRRGRAGRVQPGICYHLYTKARSDWMQEFEMPEVLRIRLEEIILTLKVLKIRDVKEFMKIMIDVPSEKGIDKSIQFLERIGALDKQENLTALGQHLSRIPVPPQIGKMLLFGSIFGCFDPIAYIAAFHSFKSPFYSVIGKEKQCDEDKRKFCDNSDQIAALNALMEWKSKSYRNQKKFCFDHFLSPSILAMLINLKKDFETNLRDLNFLNRNYDDNNLNSKNLDVVRALICGGLYPNVGYRKVAIKKSRVADSITVEGKKCLIIPGSVNFGNTSEGFIAFHELQKLNRKFFLFETTAQISPYAILLFGDDVQIENNNGSYVIIVKDLVRFNLDADTGKLIMDLRKGLDDLLDMKLKDPSPTNWNYGEGDLLTAIIEIITTNPRDYCSW